MIQPLMNTSRGNVHRSEGYLMPSCGIIRPHDAFHCTGLPPVTAHLFSVIYIYISFRLSFVRITHHDPASLGLKADCAWIITRSMMIQIGYNLARKIRETVRWHIDPSRPLPD